MSEIIDTLFVTGNDGLVGAAYENRYKFIANTAVDLVPITAPIAPVYPNLRSPNVVGSPQYFQASDHLRVLSVGVLFPYSFGIAMTPIVMALNWYAPGSVDLGRVLEFGAYGSFWVPFENYEFSIDMLTQYSPHPGVSGKCGLSALLFTGAGSDTNLMVSMVGCPAGLNAKSFYIAPFVKVLHNLPMVP